jgi:hypothetical protein
VSKPFAVGAYAHQRLNLVAHGKAYGRDAKTSNRTWEIRPSGSVSRKKLVCSVGDRPTKVKVRDRVAWIAERREIEFLMPIDKAIFRMVSKSSGRNESECRLGLERPKLQRPSSLPEGEGSMGRRKLTDATVHTGGVKATARWEGHTKQLERPSSSRRESGGARKPYNRRHRESGGRREGVGGVNSSDEAE